MDRIYIVLTIIFASCMLFRRLNCSITIFPPSIVSTEYGLTYCLKPDEYRRGVLLLCANNSILEYNLLTSNYSLIAGNYFHDGYIEGRREAARFKSVFDLTQLSQNSMVVTDSLNHCLRWINSSSTSVLAGSCTNRGIGGGDFTEARFALPFGLLLHDSKAALYVLDYWNHALILINFVMRTVQIVADFRSIQIENPLYMTCIPPECVNLYITFQHGVACYNRGSGLELIAGDVLRGNMTGSLRDTRFDVPRGILFITRYVLVIADSGNQRLLTLNMTNDNSDSVQGLYPSCLLCYNNSLYSIEFFYGIVKYEFTERHEDLICYHPDTGYPDWSTIIPTTTTTTAPTSMPTTTPTTPSTPQNLPTTNGPIEALTTSTSSTVGPTTTTTHERTPATESRSSSPAPTMLIRNTVIIIASVVGFLIVVVVISVTINKLRKKRRLTLINRVRHDKPDNDFPDTVPSHYTSLRCPADAGDAACDTIQPQKNPGSIGLPEVELNRGHINMNASQDSVYYNSQNNGEPDDNGNDYVNMQ